MHKTFFTHIFRKTHLLLVFFRPRDHNFLFQIKVLQILYRGFSFGTCISIQGRETVVNWKFNFKKVYFTLDFECLFDSNKNTTAIRTIHTVMYCTDSIIRSLLLFIVPCIPNKCHKACQTRQRRGEAEAWRDRRCKARQSRDEASRRGRPGEAESGSRGEAESTRQSTWGWSRGRRGGEARQAESTQAEAKQRRGGRGRGEARRARQNKRGEGANKKLFRQRTFSSFTDDIEVELYIINSVCESDVSPRVLVSRLANSNLIINLSRHNRVTAKQRIADTIVYGYLR